MNHKMKLTLIVTGSILFSVALLGLKPTVPQSGSNSYPIWEYKIFTDDSDLVFSMERENRPDTVKEFEKQLNILGQQDWELIDLGERCAVLKRPRNISK